MFLFFIFVNASGHSTKYVLACMGRSGGGWGGIQENLFAFLKLKVKKYVSAAHNCSVLGKDKIFEGFSCIVLCGNSSDTSQQEFAFGNLRIFRFFSNLTEVLIF